MKRKLKLLLHHQKASYTVTRKLNRWTYSQFNTMLTRKMANSSPARDYKQSKEKYLSKLDHLIVNSKYDIYYWDYCSDSRCLKDKFVWTVPQCDLFHCRQQCQVGKVLPLMKALANIEGMVLAKWRLTWRTYTYIHRHELYLAEQQRL